jgi:hypothetical protein
MTARSWTLRVTAPAQWINANGRRDRRQLAPAVRLWRNAGHTHALAAKLPHLDRAHILATLHFTDARRRDAHNFYPTLKALVDGIVDAGVLDDDSTRYLDGPDIRIGDPIIKGRNRLYTAPGQAVLVISEVSA